MAALTTNQLTLVTEARILMPEQFSLTVTDEKVLAYLNLVIADYNTWPPLSGQTVDTVVADPTTKQIILFGANVFALMFQQMRATLEDFNFSDQGFTVQVDQVGKIQASLTNMLLVYKNMIIQHKRKLILDSALGLGTPRFQSQIGQFLKLSLGSSFAWNG